MKKWDDYFQKVYDLKKAQASLEKYKILDNKQKDAITVECTKAVPK